MGTPDARLWAQIPTAVGPIPIQFRTLRSTPCANTSLRHSVARVWKFSSTSMDTHRGQQPSSMGSAPRKSAALSSQSSFRSPLATLTSRAAAGGLGRTTTKQLGLLYTMCAAFGTRTRWRHPFSARECLEALGALTTRTLPPHERDFSRRFCLCQLAPNPSAAAWAAPCFASSTLKLG